jgi:hypothetical protein
MYVGASVLEAAAPSVFMVWLRACAWPFEARILSNKHLKILDIVFPIIHYTEVLEVTLAVE